MAGREPGDVEFAVAAAGLGVYPKPSTLNPKPETAETAKKGSGWTHGPRLPWGIMPHFLLRHGLKIWYNHGNIHTSTLNPEP